MQPLPDPRFLPIPQAAPTRRCTATAQLLRQQAPRTASPEDKDDAAQGSAVGDTGPATLRLGRLLWQQRFDRFPEVVGDKGCGVHGLPSCHPASVLQHALSLGFNPVEGGAHCCSRARLLRGLAAPATMP